MRGRGGGKRFLDTGKQLVAIASKKIKCAGFNEAFDDFSVGDTRINPAAEIFQRSEVPSPLAFGDRGYHRAFPYVLDCRQSVANRAVTSRGRMIAIFVYWGWISNPDYSLGNELKSTPVHVRRQDRDTHSF